MKLRNYALVTGGYWAFTLTDGALRMLVLLHFHRLGYSPVAIAFLFLAYEFMGIVTNLIGGWVGSRTGLNKNAHRRSWTADLCPRSAQFPTGPMARMGVGHVCDGGPKRSRE
jgi:hypothetical protein